MCDNCRQELRKQGAPEFVIDLLYPEAVAEEVKPAEDTNYFKRVEAFKFAMGMSQLDEHGKPLGTGDMIRRAAGIYSWLTRGDKSND